MVEQGNVPLKKLLYVYIYIIFIYVLYECVCYFCKILNFFFFFCENGENFCWRPRKREIKEEMVWEFINYKMRERKREKEMAFFIFYNWKWIFFFFFLLLCELKGETADLKIREREVIHSGWTRRFFENNNLDFDTS